MAKYTLSAIKRNGDYWPINWTNINDFKDMDTHSLQAIDAFTTRFNSEEDLKSYLLRHVDSAFLDGTQWSYPYTITYIYGKKIRKLIHGIAYKNDAKFLDEFYVLTYLRKSIVEVDKDLINRLCNNYSKHVIQNENIYALRYYVHLLNTGGAIEIKHPTNAINDFFVKEVYQYDYTNKCYKRGQKGELLINYRGLRDLGLFLAKYEKTKSNKKETISLDKRLEELTKKESISNNGQSYKYEQTNMFDLF